ncbi:MAG: L-histidine N(alpha)-methyltransferase [Planctomycetota bacterium]
MPSGQTDGSAHPALIDDGPGRHLFLADVLDGLSRPQKRLWPKWFYDARGSEIFEAITEQPEYYPTRTERSILEGQSGDIAGVIGPNAALIEPGSGSSIKSEVVLEAMIEPAAYVPMEISRDMLEEAVERLRGRFPGLPVHPVAADFMDDMAVPEIEEDVACRVVFFPGSTFGNMEKNERAALLDRFHRLAAETPEGEMCPGGLLMGFDLHKDTATLEAAYNDAAGVTAEFNLNLLTRINSELGGDFDLDGFEHRAVYDPIERRIEMRLYALEDQTVTVDEQSFEFEAGEHILTEYSHKFTRESMAEELHESRFEAEHVWTDEDDRFGLVFARA